MSRQKRPVVAREKAGLLILLASFGVLGCAVLVAGTLIAQMAVPDHDWIADTISDLAAGRLEIIMDVALYGFAAGILATALAAAHAHLGDGGWSLGVVSLACLAALVVVIAARNEYGDGDSEGIVIHTYLVYGLGLLFLVVPFVMAEAIGYESRRARLALLWLGGLWAVASPVFFFLPNDVDGLYERALGLIACGILCVLCAVFLRRGRAAH